MGSLQLHMIDPIYLEPSFRIEIMQEHGSQNKQHPSLNRTQRIHNGPKDRVLKPCRSEPDDGQTRRQRYKMATKQDGSQTRKTACVHNNSET